MKISFALIRTKILENILRILVLLSKCIANTACKYRIYTVSSQCVYNALDDPTASPRRAVQLLSHGDVFERVKKKSLPHGVLGDGTFVIF